MRHAAVSPLAGMAGIILATTAGTGPSPSSLANTPDYGADMKVEWNVYANGHYIGSVFAGTEEDARCAAFSQYDLPEDASLSVSRR